MKKLLLFVSAVLVLAGVVFFAIKVQEKNDVEGEIDTAEDHSENQIADSPHSNLETSNHEVAAKFAAETKKFKNDIPEQYREAANPVYFELKAALSLLRQEKLPEEYDDLREEIYAGLNGKPKEGHPQRSEKMFLDLMKTLEGLEGEHPESFRNIFAIALLRSSFPEDTKGVTRRSLAGDFWFQKTGLKKAKELTGVSYYSGDDKDQRIEAIANFGKNILGIK